VAGVLSHDAPVLLAAAAGAGFGHAVLPDHWLPLAVVARTRRYPLRRVARLAGLAGVAHVLTSIILGGVIIAIGLQFRSSIESAQDTIAGVLLIATGVALIAVELLHRKHGHSGHEHGHPHPHQSGGGRFANAVGVMAPFGAAASPDLTILPVFLAAATVGVATAVGSLIIFGAVTIGTIVGLCVTATRWGYEIRARWLDRWGNGLTALVLVLIGALIASHLV
jgi:threonine/homoserine/homoserine lactone efflux protein